MGHLPMILSNSAREVRLKLVVEREMPADTRIMALAGAAWLTSVAEFDFISFI